MNKFPACNGSCNQGRGACDCIAEFPPINRWTAAIAVIVVALAAAVSYVFPLGILTP